MKSLLKIFAIALFMLAALTTKVSAANVDMSGYAWGADNSPFGGVGWINFNNTSTGSNTAVSNTEYKVEFNQTTWEMVGYAWSERYGYIKFGGFDDADFPSAKTACATNPKNTSSYGPCNVHIIDNNSGGYQLVGYARFCFVYASGCSGTLKPNSELAGYDGWIGFKTSSGTVAYSNSTKSFSGYAWGGGSASSSSADYGEGSGWIKMDPNGVSMKCIDTSKNALDCLNSNGPIVDITTSAPKVNLNTDVVLTWTVTNIPSGCTPVTSSSPTNSTWNNYTPTGADIASGTKNVGKITETTTFTLSCTYSGKKGSDDQIVEVDARTPSIDMTATQSTFGADQKADIKYSISNIPNGCSATLTNKNTNTAVFTNKSIVNSGGDPATVISGTEPVTGLLGNPVVFELTCVDTAPPSPSRSGTATVSLTPDEATVIDFSVTDKTTNATNSSATAVGTIPCTNTGLDMKTSIKGVVVGSCKAMTDGSGSNSVWGSSVSWTQTEETNHPTVTTKTTGNVTQTGNPILYQVQCRSLTGSLVTKAIKMSRSCTPGSLAISSSKACVAPGDPFIVSYNLSGLIGGSCVKSGTGFTGTISQGTITDSRTISGGVTNGMTPGTYTYTIDQCQDASNPSGATLSKSVNVDISTTCNSTGTCTDGIQNGDETGVDAGGRCGCANSSSNRCPKGGSSGSGPIFKEF